jgi:hypothetical protein
MSTTSTPITWSSQGGGVADRGVDERRGRTRPWQRLAAVIWDSQFLRAQRAVYFVAPRVAAHLDELARRRDAERWTRSRAGDHATGHP